MPAGGRALARRLDFRQVFQSKACQIILEVFSRKGNVHRAGDILCMRYTAHAGASAGMRMRPFFARSRVFPRGENQRVHFNACACDQGELR
jgi:hypothetical protein